MGGALVSRRSVARCAAPHTRASFRNRTRQQQRRQARTPGGLRDRDALCRCLLDLTPVAPYETSEARLRSLAPTSKLAPPWTCHRIVLRETTRERESNGMAPTDLECREPRLLLSLSWWSRRPSRDLDLERSRRDRRRRRRSSSLMFERRVYQCARPAPEGGQSRWLWGSGEREGQGKGKGGRGGRFRRPPRCSDEPAAQRRRNPHAAQRVSREPQAARLRCEDGQQHSRPQGRARGDPRPLARARQGCPRLKGGPSRSTSAWGGALFPIWCAK